MPPCIRLPEYAMNSGHATQQSWIGTPGGGEAAKPSSGGTRTHNPAHSRYCTKLSAPAHSTARSCRRKRPKHWAARPHQASLFCHYIAKNKDTALKLCAVVAGTYLLHILPFLVFIKNGNHKHLFLEKTKFLTLASKLTGFRYLRHRFADSST